MNTNNNGRHPARALRILPLAMALYGASMLTLALPAMAQTVVASGKTSTYAAHNGVQVVDIASANSAGVSHNLYTQFNVPIAGMVLNNGDTSQLSRQSQLAGDLLSNPNLPNSAKIIINEVTSANRSTLAGYVEVLGARADVVIANPYGITCSGCGFINTPRATLTTGVPSLDANGNLSGFRVTQGDLLVNGAGLDGRSLDYLDLVARSVRLDGQVNTRDLTLAAGNNTWDYASREASAIAGADTANAPAIGIDSSALGGMYANRIRLLSTERGVGVRLLADAAASAAELTLTASGQILIQSHLSAQQGDIALSSADAGADALTLSGANANLSGRNVSLLTTTAGGGITLADGGINATGNLLVSAAGDLRDSAASAGATRFAHGTLTLNAGGAATLQRTIWGADGALHASVGALAIGDAGASLYSGVAGIDLSTTGGALALNGASLTTPGAVRLSATGGALSVGAGGTVQAGDSVVLSASQAINNAGTVLAVTGLTANSAELINSGRLQAGAALSASTASVMHNLAGATFLAGGALALHADTLANDGTMQGVDAVTADIATTMSNRGKLLSTSDIAISSGQASFALDNQNLIQAGGKLTLGATGHVANVNNSTGAALLGTSEALALGALTNSGTVQAQTGIDLSAGGDVHNAATGQILTRGTPGAGVNLNVAGALDNAGTLQSAGALVAHAGGALSNSGLVLTQDATAGGSAGGIVLSGSRLDNSGMVSAASTAGLTSASVFNNNGTVQSSGTLSATVGTALNNGSNGKLLSTAGIGIGSLNAAFSVDNRNRIQAAGTLTIGSGGHVADLDNGAGALVQGESETLTLASLSNSGILQSQRNLTISTRDRALNAGTGLIITTSGDFVLTAAQDLANAGRLQSSGALSVAAGGAVDNSGVMLTLDSASGGTNAALHLTADSLDNSGALQAAGALDATLVSTLRNSGSMVAATDLQLNASGASLAVANLGRLQATGRLNVGAAGRPASFSNGGNAVVLGDTMSLSAGSLSNAGIMQAEKGLAIDATGNLVVSGSGVILSGDALHIAAGDANLGGVVQSASALTVTTVGALNNSGQILTLDADSGGSAGSLALQAQQITNSGTVASGGSVALAAATTLTNAGIVQGASALSANTGSAFNNTGSVVSAGDVRISGTGAVFGLVNDNHIEAGGALIVGGAGHVANLDNNNGGVMLGSTGALALGTLSNDGVLQTAGNLHVTAGTVDNAVHGLIQTTSQGAGMVVATTGAVSNEGALLSSGDLALTAGGNLNNSKASTSLATSPSGSVVSDGNLMLRAASLDNTGLLAGGGTSNVDVDGAVTNSGTLQGQSAVALTAGALHNLADGKLLSAGDIAIHGDGGFALTNAGRIQAAGELSTGATSTIGSINNAVGAYLLGGSVGLHAGTVDNAGLVQGKNGLTINADGALYNRASGQVLTTGVAGKDVLLTAGSLNNQGSVQSSGDLTLHSDTSLDNGGSLLTEADDGHGGGGANGTLRVSAVGVLNNSAQALSNGSAEFAAGDYMVNAGRAQSRGTLTLDTGTSLRNTGFMVSGDTMALTSTRSVFVLNNSGSIESARALNVGAAGHAAQLTNTAKIIGGGVVVTGDTLYNQGAAASVMSVVNGGGDVTLNLAGALHNEGVLHADGALNVAAASIGNTADGAFSSKGALSLTASDGDIYNQGWIFGLDNLTLTALGHQIHNAAAGNIETGTAAKSLVITTADAQHPVNGAFVNENYIHSAGALTIDTGSFINQAAGGMPTIVEGPLLLVKAAYQVGDSGDFHCNVFGKNCAHSRLYEIDYTSNQSFATTPGAPAQLLAGGRLTINYRSTAENTASVISGQDVAITGAGGSSNFVNRDLTLLQKQYARLVWIRADSDETRYADSEAAFDQVAGHYNDDEAPASWKYYNTDYDAAQMAATGLPYAKLMGQGALANQVVYSAGIYASNSFHYSGTGLTLHSGTPAPSGCAATTCAPAQAGGTLAALTQTKGQAGDSGANLAASPLNNAMTGGGLMTVNGRDGVASGGKLAPLAGSGTSNGLTPVAGSAGSAAAGQTTVVGANGVSFIGPNLALPTSPNGLYVVAKDSNASYLVETNPLYGANSAQGSTYLAERLGLNPSTIEKRLGDANYEGKLVRDQLVAQTNNFMLAGYASESQQIKGLLDNAVEQEGHLGLIFGAALTSEQAGKLTKDMVWMVETVVNGQKVLAPVVYLSAATRDAVLSGSVIAARDVTINATSVNNDGGTIKADHVLAITTTGDITNTGGKLSGDSVALTSTAGSIVNQTAAQFYGSDSSGRTSIGATGSITAAKDLAISAARDVRVIGAVVAAGADAGISAGNNVVFDTIQDKRADSSAGSSSGGAFGTSSSWTRNDVEVKQVGATLAAGGNLAIKSGNDVTIAGSQVKAGGNVAVDAGNNLNLVDRQDLSKVTTSTSTSGFTASASGTSVGVGTETNKITTTTTIGTSVAGSITSGGDTSLNAGKTVTVRGSDVKAGGDLAVAGTDVQVLAGQNTYDQTVDKKKTTTGISLGADVSAITGVVDMAKNLNGSSAGDIGKLGAKAALTAAQLSATGGVPVNVGLSTTVSTSHTEDSNSTARVSTFTSGGKTQVTAAKTATFEGTQVNAGGDIDVKATDINMVTARNTTSHTEQSSVTKVDIAAPTNVMAVAAKATADSLYSGGEGAVKLATVANTVSDSARTTDTGTSTSFKSGGNTTRTASGTITDQASQIATAGNFSQSATTINMQAAGNTATETSKTVTNTGTVSVSLDFDTASAISKAKDGSPTGVMALASGPTLGVNMEYERKADSSASASSTAVVGSISAGGNISSTSTGDTRIQGATLASRGDTTIAAKALTVAAAADTSSYSNDGSDVKAKARVEVDKSVTPAGSLEASYGTTTSQGTASTAVTGAIIAGGNLKVTTTGDARFEGTALAAGGDAAIKAGGSVIMDAAHSTESNSSAERTLSAGVSASKDGSAGVKLGVSTKDASDSLSTASVASINAGKNLTIDSGKDVTLEGSQVGAGNDATIKAKGNVNLNASTDTSHSSSTTVDASLSGSQTATSRKVAASATVALASASASDQEGVSIATGNNLKISSGGATAMQGTQIDAAGKVDLDASGGVVKTDTVQESSSSGLKVSAYVQAAAKRGGAAAAAAPATQGTVAKVKEVKNSKSFPVAYAAKSGDSSSSTTSVAIREGSGAMVAPPATIATVASLPSVKAATQLNAELNAPLAKYGTLAAMPDSVKRDILAKAGVTVKGGESLDVKIVQIQTEGKQEVTKKMATDSLSPSQQSAVLQALGMDK